MKNETGIPAAAILRFLDRLEHYQVNMHSVILMRHGVIAAEGYYAPFTPHTLHRMFSVCKTLNAVAIGLLAEEGKLSLDDRIVSFFPDKVPEDVHPWISEMTIRNLLMMRTCHASTTYKYDSEKEWVESFFTVPPTHKPGTVFHYDTSAAHVLCALTERLTGTNMLDYLRKKCLNKIGWSKESYVLKNEFEDSQGGSGLMATPRDLLLLGRLLMQQGNWEGEQLLPGEYVKEMTSNLTPNVLTGGVISEAQGYGYQVWRTRHDGFACYGMGGQLAVCLPNEDLILVTTADTQGCGGGNDLIYNSFYEEILPALDAELSPEEEHFNQSKLSARLARLSLTPLQRWVRPIPREIARGSFLNPQTCAGKINQRTFRIQDNPQGFSELSLQLWDKEGVFSYCRNGKHSSLYFGLETCKEGRIPFYDMCCAASGVWLSENTFYIKVHILDTSIGSLHIELVFGEDDVTVFLKKIEETLFSEFNGHLYGTLA